MDNNFFWYKNDSNCRRTEQAKMNSVYYILRLSGRWQGRHGCLEALICIWETVKNRLPAAKQHGVRFIITEKCIPFKSFESKSSSQKRFHILGLYQKTSMKEAQRSSVWRKPMQMHSHRFREHMWYLQQQLGSYSSVGCTQTCMQQGNKIIYFPCLEDGAVMSFRAQDFEKKIFSLPVVIARDSQFRRLVRRKVQCLFIASIEDQKGPLLQRYRCMCCKHTFV